MALHAISLFQAILTAIVAGEDINSKGERGETALHVAVRNVRRNVVRRQKREPVQGQVEASELLLLNGAKWNEQDDGEAVG